jgi:type I restriction enzyme, S subunit
MAASLKQLIQRAKAAPMGWARTHLGQIVYQSLTKAEPQDAPNARYVGLEHIAPNINRLCGIGKALTVRSTKSLFSTGDVLYGKLRPYLNKVFVAPFSGICSTDILVLRPERKIEPAFIEAILRTATFINFATQSSRGVSLPRTNFKKIAPFPIWVAPSAEQKRIAKKLARLLKREQRIRGALETLPALMDKYVAAVLKAACTGQLVPTEGELARKERREYETAAELIHRVGVLPRPKRFESRNLETIDTGHPALVVGRPSRSLPQGWTWTPLVDVARIETGHTPSRKHPDWWGGKVPWVGIVDARENHGRTITKTSQTTNERGLANSAARLLPKGTVCVSRTASIGYVVILGRAMATSQDFVNWTPTGAVLSDWLKLVFMSDRETLARFGKGAIHTTIYFPEWLSMHIALPPLAEQQRIVVEVQRRLSAMGRVRREFQSALEQTSRLRASLFYKRGRDGGY